jgi:hypothetical protein
MAKRAAPLATTSMSENKTIVVLFQLTGRMTGVMTTQHQAEPSDRAKAG